MRSILLVALLSVPTYLGYYLLPDVVSRSWAYYVASGFLVVALADGYRRTLAASWAVALLWWIEVEAGQQAACGIAQWGHEVHTDLCVQWFGPDVYRAVAAIAVAGLLTWRPNRQP